MASFSECIKSDTGNGAIGRISNANFMGLIEVWQSTQHPGFFYVDTKDVRSGLWETTKRPVRLELAIHQISKLACDLESGWDISDRRDEVRFSAFPKGELN